MKRILILIVIVVVAIALWFISRPYDVKANLTFDTTTGNLVQLLKMWVGSERVGKLERLENGDKMKLTITEDAIAFELIWNFSSRSNGTSEVEIWGVQKDADFGDRVKIPFIETNIENAVREQVMQFKYVVDSHLQKTKVEVTGATKTDSLFCVYVPVQTAQRGKAFGMMKYFPLLTSYVLDNNLKPNGHPMVVVTEWDTESDVLKFDFCYPIVFSDSLPSGSIFNYKWVPSVNGLKATYNGNYITSDRAWYALDEYAIQNGVSVCKNPIEIFYDNPNFGGDESAWRADVIMPIITE